MLRRLSFAISTAHAVSLAIREMPDAIRTVCDVAKAVIENDNTNHASRKFLKAAFARAKERDEARGELDLVEYIANEVWLWAKEKITQLQIDADSLGGALTMEHKIATDYAAKITEAREWLIGIASGLGHGLGSDTDSLLSVIERVEEGIRHNLKVITEMRHTAQNERDVLKSKLAIYEEAERWHQVTDGEGELPPSGLDVLYKFSPFSAVNCGAPYPASLTFAWRYLSSQDVTLKCKSNG